MTPGSIFKAFFYLFGTFLHESAHFISALLFGESSGFSLIPGTEENRIVFGRTTARVRCRVFHAFIAAAPLIWWFALGWLLNISDVPHLILTSPERAPAVIMKKIMHFSVKDLLFLWLAFQLFWAGKPSRQDVKIFFRGIVSPSGIALLAVLGMIIAFLRRW